MIPTPQKNSNGFQKIWKETELTMSLLLVFPTRHDHDSVLRLLWNMFAALHKRTLRPELSSHNGFRGRYCFFSFSFERAFRVRGSLTKWKWWPGQSSVCSLITSLSFSCMLNCWCIYSLSVSHPWPAPNRSAGRPISPIPSPFPC